MEPYEAILAEHSKAQTNAIIKWVDNFQTPFDQLFSLFIKDEYRVIQRSAWPVSYCVIQHPELIKNHFRKLIKNLHIKGLHNAVKRNTLRLLQNVDIPERFQGEIMHLCFSYITSFAEAPAIKAFALTILQNLSQYYPKIKNKVKIIIEERWKTESPAFRSRAKKFLLS